MQEFGPDLPTKGAEVWCMTIALQGTTAEWMVTLHNDNTLELCNFDYFMTALQKHFEDPLADRKARTRIETIS